MPLLSEVVGVTGGYKFLLELEQSPEPYHSLQAIAEMMVDCGISSPNATLQEFIAYGLLHRQGNEVRLSSSGIKSCLLLQALNGGSLSDVFRRLRSIEASLQMYELVQQGMTTLFLESLIDRPGVARLYFCSPWINPDEYGQRILRHHVLQAERRRGIKPEILVITRPVEGTEDTMPGTLKVFEEVDATIFLHKRLHSKVYIREPNLSGGYAMAIVGSQNLTRSNHLELGIRVNNDTQMIQQLVRYFLNLTNFSIEARGRNHGE